jgi:hypothetical protein
VKAFQTLFADALVEVDEDPSCPKSHALSHVAHDFWFFGSSKACSCSKCAG